MQRLELQRPKSEQNMYNLTKDAVLASVNEGSHHLGISTLNETFGGKELVTPQSLSEKLHIPPAKALRWHKWLAGGKEELSVEMMLAKAAELHSADSKKVCGILFEVYDEDDDGHISISV